MTVTLFNLERPSVWNEVSAWIDQHGSIANPELSKLAKVDTLKASTLDVGSPVHSFKTLIQDLQTIVRNTCRSVKDSQDGPSFDLITTPTTKQKHALELINRIKL